MQNVEVLIYMVPGAGIEPARYFYRGILSPLRLPVPPSGHTVQEKQIWSGVLLAESGSLHHSGTA